VGSQKEAGNMGVHAQHLYGTYSLLRDNEGKMRGQASLKQGRQYADYRRE
jgi:hypothetical protein